MTGSAVPGTTANAPTPDSAERSAPRLAVIYASVRDDRFGPVIGGWFVSMAEQYGAFGEIDIIDLADHELPLRMPAFGADPAPETSRVMDGLAERLGAADAFVVVTPEYNHSYPASLKNAIDWFRSEWHAKPVGFVSYGGVSGGLRAVEHLRQVFAELHATTVRDVLSFPVARELFDDGGQPRDQEATGTAAKSMLNQMQWWTGALREARARNPYVP